MQFVNAHPYWNKAASLEFQFQVLSFGFESRGTTSLPALTTRWRCTRAMFAWRVRTQCPLGSWRLLGFVPFLLNIEDAEESTLLPELVDAEADRCLITRCFNVQTVPGVSKGSLEVGIEGR
jgi:hypothetical protein